MLKSSQVPLWWISRHLPREVGRLENFPPIIIFLGLICQPYGLVGGRIGVQPDTNADQPT